MKKTKYYSPNRPTRHFQGEEKEDINVYSSESGKHFYQRTLSHEAANNYVEQAIALPEKASNSTASQLLFVALLEHVCNIHEPDPDKARELYQMLCKHLRKMKVIDPLKGVDEFCSIRSQCKNSFIKLMQGCVTNIHKENRPQILEDRVQLFFQPSVISHQPLIEFPLLSKFKDEYVKVKELGSGAYGSVYETKHKIDDCNYAVKKIGFEGYKDDMMYQVLREVKFLAKLSHQNIVRYHHAWIEHELLNLGMLPDIESRNDEPLEVVTGPRAIQYDTKQAEGLNLDTETTDIDYDNYSDQFVVFEHSYTSQKTVLENDSNTSSRDYSRASQIQKPCFFVYIQMELCDTNLKDWLEKRNHQYSAGDRSVLKREINLSILKQLFRAVCHIHSTDLIHRDLKPHNIFIRSSDNILEIKVGDFGLSRTIKSSGDIQGNGCTPLTPHPGVTRLDFDWTQYTSGVGTTIYAAPEQLSGSDYSQKSDMYSLGLIMYEIYQPFGTEMERRNSLTNLRKTGVLEEFKTEWPVESKYIQSLLKQDQNDRPTAREMLETELFLSKDKIINNLKASLEEKDSIIKEKDTIIYELKQKLKQRDDESLSKDTEIERLKLELLSLKLPPSYASISKTS